jgi:hypothetical protein
MKIFSNKLKRNLVIGTFVAHSVALMLVMSYGSFDPTTQGFWLCVFQSVVFTIWLNWSIVKKLFNYAKEKWGISQES